MDIIKIGICEPDGFSEQAITDLKTIGHVQCFDGDSIKKFVQDKNIIFVRLKYKIDQELIDSCNDLRYICSPTTGLNHISISNPHVKVISLQGESEFLSSIRATPEHIMGLTLALIRNYKSAFLTPHNNCWNRELYRGYELYKSNIGIIGMGRVGRLLAKYFSAFDAMVRYCDIKKEEVMFAEQVETINELVEKSDIVILAANYTKANNCMINDEVLKLMKDKYFINAARGELVDEEALLLRISKNWFRGVAIDVLEEEAAPSNRLMRFLCLMESRNLLVTPHIGGATFASMERTEEFIVNKLICTIRKNDV